MRGKERKTCTRPLCKLKRCQQACNHPRERRADRRRPRSRISSMLRFSQPSALCSCFCYGFLSEFLANEQGGDTGCMTCGLSHSRGERHHPRPCATLTSSHPSHLISVPLPLVSCPSLSFPSQSHLKCHALDTFAESADQVPHRHILVLLPPTAPVCVLCDKPQVI